jgi:hypothetical protein
MVANIDKTLYPHEQFSKFLRINFLSILTILLLISIVGTVIFSQPVVIRSDGTGAEPFLSAVSVLVMFWTIGLLLALVAKYFVSRGDIVIFDNPGVSIFELMVSIFAIMFFANTETRIEGWEAILCSLILGIGLSFQISVARKLP